MEELIILSLTEPVLAVGVPAHNILQHGRVATRISASSRVDERAKRRHGAQPPTM